jgi:signal transduction histidine kinase
MGLALLVALVALVGRLLNRPLWVSYDAQFIPMAVDTAIGIVLLAAAPLLALRPASGTRAHAGVAIFGCLVSAYGLVVWLIASLVDPAKSVGHWIAAPADVSYHSILSQMAPSTGALFALAGMALVGLVLGHRQRVHYQRWLLSAVALGSTLAICAGLIVLSYLIEVPLFYDGAQLPMALPTAICLLLGTGMGAMAILAAPARGRWPRRLADLSVALQLQGSLAGIVLAVFAFGFLVDLQSDELWLQTKSLYEHPLAVTIALGDLRGAAWRMQTSLAERTWSSDSVDYAAAQQDLAAGTETAERALDTLTANYLGDRTDIVLLRTDWQRMQAARAAWLRAPTASIDDALTRKRLIADGTAAAVSALGRIDVIAAFARNKSAQLYTEADRRNRALDATAVMVFLATLVVCVWIGWQLTRQIAQPLTELTTATERFGQGKFDVRSSSGSGNEFGSLATTFNTMAATIQAGMQSTALLTEQLRRSEASLAAQNKELEAFSYSVSHDLRAPLRSIDGFSRILLEEYEAKLAADGRDSLKRIRAATQRMAQLIDDLLRLSRLSRGELHYEPVDLSTMVGEIGAELSAQDPQRRVTLVVAEGVIVNGDRQLLRIALSNLLGNAWKFTGKRVDARIEFGTQDQNGRRTYFVHDNGVGFDPAYADKLFGAFQRLHSSSEYPGTGIGLATVQRVIRRHGGSVWAGSAIDQGATFSFELETQITRA